MSAVTLTNRPLAANEVFTQGKRDRFNDREPIGSICGLIYSDKAGTLLLEESDDGTTFTTTATVNVSAATNAELAWTDLTKRWYRFKYTNGAAAQTSFALIQQSRGLDIIVESSVADGADVTLGAKADAAATVADATPFSVIALLKGLWNKLAGTLDVSLSGSNIEQTNGADAAAKSALVAGKTAAGKGVPLLVTDEGKVVTAGDSMVAAGKVSVPDLFDHAIETTGFNSISIINDGPAELVIAIDESSLDGTKLIHIGDSEAFSRNISGNDLHYSIANDACTFRYALL